MSMQIDVAFVQQYKSNVFHLSQQKGSRLRPFVRSEMQNGKRQFFERLGSTAAIKKVSRHSDTPQIDSQHSRRACTMEDYIWADLIDDEDKIRMLIEPASPYAQAAMWAMGRAMDEAIINDGLLGTAYSGEAGTTPVVLPDSQKVLAATDAAPGTPTDLNIDTLRRVKYSFDKQNIDPSLPRYFGITASQLRALLKQTEVTSADYANVKALVQGQVDTFMGFKFVQTELFPTGTVEYSNSTGAIGSGGGTNLVGARRCAAWIGDGVVLAVGRDMEAKIEPRADKNYATQVFARMSIGSARIEEVKVQEVVCKEA